MLCDELRLLYIYVFARFYVILLAEVVISPIGVPVFATMHYTFLLDE